MQTRTNDTAQLLVAIIFFAASTDAVSLSGWDLSGTLITDAHPPLPTSQRIRHEPRRPIPRRLSRHRRSARSGERSRSDGLLYMSLSHVHHAASLPAHIRAFRCIDWAHRASQRISDSARAWTRRIPRRRSTQGQPRRQRTSRRPVPPPRMMISHGPRGLGRTNARERV